MVDGRHRRVRRDLRAGLGYARQTADGALHPNRIGLAAHGGRPSKDVAHDAGPAFLRDGLRLHLRPGIRTWQARIGAGAAVRSSDRPADFHCVRFRVVRGPADPVQAGAGLGGLRHDRLPRRRRRRRTLVPEIAMKQATFNHLAGTIFLLVALLHAARLFFHWGVLIAGRSIPMWVSWPALALAGFLVYSVLGQKK